MRIGILGGIGPEATGEFYLKLIKRLQESGLIKENTDFPQIFINSIPAPELVFDNISPEDMQVYLDGVIELDSMEVDMIVMVCNTVHLYHDILQARVRAPIVDLPKELEKYVRENKVGSVLVMGTPSTVRKGLYRFEGIDTVEPTKKDLEKLSKAVFDFNRGVEGCEKDVLSVYEKYDADLAVLGCTELGVMLKGVPAVDPMDVLIDKVIDVFKQHKVYMKKCVI